MTDTAVPSRSALPALRRPDQRQLLIGSSALALAAAGVLGVRWWVSGRFMIATDNAYVRADVVTLSSRVAGDVAEVSVADNQWVRAGDQLARIDDRDYRMKVEQAGGAVAAARAGISAGQSRIASLDAQAVEQRSLVAADTAAVTAREADARFADLVYHRQTNLQQQHVTSTQELQSAEAATHRTEAELVEARASLAAGRARLSVFAAERDIAVAEADQAQATLRQAEAILAAARLDLERTRISAPVAGRVGQRSVRAGQYADVGLPLMALVPAQPYVIANYKETQTSHIHPGQPVRIVVDAEDGTALTGRVESLAPASGAEFALLPPDNATGNFTKIVQRIPVRIRIDPGQPRATALRPGMSVETTIDTREPQ